MAITMAQLGTILRSWLQGALADGYTAFDGLLFSAEWYANYQAIYKTLLREKTERERVERWNVWLAKRKPSVRMRLERLNPSGWQRGRAPARSALEWRVP